MWLIHCIILTYSTFKEFSADCVRSFTWGWSNVYVIVWVNYKIISMCDYPAVKHGAKHELPCPKQVDDSLCWRCVGITCRKQYILPDNCFIKLHPSISVIWNYDIDHCFPVRFGQFNIWLSFWYENYKPKFTHHLQDTHWDTRGRKCHVTPQQTKIGKVAIIVFHPFFYWPSSHLQNE